ncbi:MAG: PEP-CTERM sorting domain-containing protein [Planctomycetota bacterium]
MLRTGLKSVAWSSAALLMTATSGAYAYTTSLGQTWETAPDAWVPGTSADSAYFGWDDLESSGTGLGFGTILDDTTPDLGIATPDARFFQGTDGLNDPSPTFYGHRSGSGNYYTGFTGGITDDTITGVAPASGSGGYTTLVIQALGQPGNSVPGIDFVASAGWTKVKDLYGTTADGSGEYWQEWTAPGDNLAFSVDLDGPPGGSSYALDAFQVHTYWTPGSSPVVNSISAVPEPSSLALLGLGGLAMIRRRRSK